MLGALLFALTATSIASIAAGVDHGNVALLTSPIGLPIRSLAGEPLNVSCEGIGGEAGKFRFLRWTKDGGQEISGDPRAVKIGNKLFLTFTNPKTHDSGSYSCSSIYDNGVKLQEKLFFEFYATKPEFPITFENVTLQEGGYHYLMCQAYGETPIEYKWFNQDQDEISQDIGKSVYVSNYKSHSRLIFQKLRKDQEGSYTCEAINSHGMSSKVYSVWVEPSTEGNDTDTARFRDARVLGYTTRNVTFYITTSGAVEYIEARYREGIRNSNTTTVRFTPVPNNKTYEVRDLLTAGLYSFQFRTIPPENNGWSREYNVTLLPNAPEVIWRNIGERSVTLERFLKFADSLRGTIDKYQIKYFMVQQQGGNIWVSKNCTVTIEVPICYGSSYTIWGLSKSFYYQIEVRDHTEGGYGKPTSQKVFLLDPASRV